ncbi:MAG: L,D-transpeptidase [Longimicrobiaceae bacterium]
MTSRPVPAPALARLLLLVPLALAAPSAARAQAADDAVAAVAAPPAAPVDTARSAPSAPRDPLGARILAEAERARGLRVIVSLADRTLWLKQGTTVLHAAPVAVGKAVVMEYEGKEWNFSTPRGRRTITTKQRNPVWVPPDWHYVELALKLGLQLEFLGGGQRMPLGDGSWVAVRGNRIGRLLADGSFQPVPVGEEAVFNDTLFAPPPETVNRRMPGELGRYKLDMGGGYYLHGTPYQDSIGSEVTHGCIRMREADLELLYRRVPVGTPVYIY